MNAECCKSGKSIRNCHSQTLQCISNLVLSLKVCVQAHLGPQQHFLSQELKVDCNKGVEEILLVSKKPGAKHPSVFVAQQ